MLESCEVCKPRMNTKVHVKLKPYEVCKPRMNTKAHVKLKLDDVYKPCMNTKTYITSFILVFNTETDSWSSFSLLNN